MVRSERDDEPKGVGSGCGVSVIDLNSLGLVGTAWVPLRSGKPLLTGEAFFMRL